MTSAFSNHYFNDYNREYCPQRKHDAIIQMLDEIEMNLKGLDIQSLSRPALNEGIFLPFITRMNLAVELFANLNIFSISEDIIKSMRSIYFRYRWTFALPNKQVSFVDFLIKALGNALNLPIVSYDNHLAFTLRDAIPGEVYWPQDIATFNRSGIVILDTNVIVGMATEKLFEKRIEIQHLLKNSKIILFVPDEVIHELENLMNRNKDPLKKRKNGIYPSKKNKLEVDEEHFDYTQSSKKRKFKPKYKKYHYNFTK